MTGLVARSGRSVRLVRTVIEVLGGWLLGGTLGPATVVCTLAIGPLVHLLLPPLTVNRQAERAASARRQPQPQPPPQQPPP